MFGCIFLCRFCKCDVQPGARKRSVVDHGPRGRELRVRLVPGRRYRLCPHAALNVPLFMSACVTRRMHAPAAVLRYRLLIEARWRRATEVRRKRESCERASERFSHKSVLFSASSVKLPPPGKDPPKAAWILEQSQLVDWALRVVWLIFRFIFFILMAAKSQVLKHQRSHWMTYRYAFYYESDSDCAFSFQDRKKLNGPLWRTASGRTRWVLTSSLSNFTCREVGS